MGNYYVIRNKVTGALHVPTESSSITPRLYSTEGRAHAARPHRPGWPHGARENWEVVPVSLIERKE